MKKSVFKMPVPVKINGRTSSITNSFFNGIIPVIEPSEEDVLAALKVLGMDEDTICCAYCGDKYTEWDHLNPLIRNKRPTGYVSEIHNLVPACGKCNQSKGNKPWKKWMLSDALQSPASRGIPDIKERIERIESYENTFQPMLIDIEGVVGKELWEQHLKNLERLIALMNECQELSDEIRTIISSKYENSKTVRPIRNNSDDEYSNLKIGEIAQNVLKPILERGSVSDEEIILLQDKSYCKKCLDLNFPLLVKQNSDYDKKRYYTKPLTIKGISYLMCSQWVEGKTNNDRPYLLKWIEEHSQY